MKVSDNTSIDMPIRNLLSIVVAVAIGVWAYFGVIARVTTIETSLVLAEKDLEKVKQKDEETRSKIKKSWCFRL